ncbi:protein kinase [Scytonema tolypothrichoides VB-61278]|nr:protein kinase [Scytonema tolypothrichoides VB-61278]
MPTKVTLTITEGTLKGQEFIFDSRTTCIIGRAKDCNPQLPDDETHKTISRYHCLLDINPPAIRIRDFGSRNGTYVNDAKIGQRQPEQTPEEAAKLTFPEYDLHTGDEIKLGNTVFAVSVEVNPESINIPNFFPGTVDVKQNPTQPPNLLEIIKRWLGLAESGNSNLKAIRGYSLIKLLGKGGFGEVYLAQHNHSGKFVALKLMLPAIAANEDAIQRFLREMDNTKALGHPNVVQLMDYGFYEGIFFFTMDYCSGGSVSDLMQQQGGRLSIDIAVPIILQVLNGLEYTHNAEIPYVKFGDGSFGKGRGLVHRDLKPGNIFLSYSDGKLTAKIGDYGLAKAFDQAGLSGQTMSGTKAGTPAFMPRQQVINFKYAKPEVDIWATAASLYFMLTGAYPRNFVGSDPFLAVLQTNAVPIRDRLRRGEAERDASIPEQLAQLIDQALVDKPEIHFKSAAGFKQALLSVM